MSASPPSVPARSAARSLGPIWLLVALALVLGVTVGIVVAFVSGRSSSRPAALAPAPTRPAATWAAGKRRAPDFRLHDQVGQLISLSSLHGRPVLLTFIDPVCRNLCPLEAKVLNGVEQRLPVSQRPAIVAVSVNPWADARTNLRVDARKWHLSRAWRWALGREGELAPVWHQYAIGVRVLTRMIAGVRLRTVEHTEGSYLIDRAGYVRALFLFPFTAADVARTTRQVAAAPS